MAKILLLTACLVASTYAVIITEDPPLVQIVSKESKVEAYTIYRVECSIAASLSSANITWWKDDIRLADQVKNIKLPSNNIVSILEFTTSFDDDGKNLTCRAEDPNIPIVVEDTWFLNVRDRPWVSLRLGFGLNINEIFEGNDVYFECEARANPEVQQLSWFKDGWGLKDSMPGVIFSDNKLVLLSVTRNTTGNYTCAATNSEGGTVTEPLFLRVKARPELKD